MKILVLNAGSSSQKSCLYDLADTLPEQPPSPVWEAQIDWNHQPNIAEVEIKTSSGTTKHELPINSRAEVIARMLETLWQGDTQVIANPQDINVVGHRVVHGGQEYQQPIVITPEVKAAIARLAVFAPIHNPANLEGIEAIEKILGNSILQVAVFDTAFHSQLPIEAAIYPAVYEWFEQGIRRYGFHGISHEYCAQRTAKILGRDLISLRLITCHLGNGCSLAAIKNGKSIDTTMGFTPLEGLMMCTRSCSIDPGILIHLLQTQGYTADKLDLVLNKESGLKGISGVSSDMREINKASAEGNKRAKLAFDIFVHRLRSHIGAMLTTLGGLDALVFTAGIGENSALVRAAACENLEFLGIKLDLDKNQQSGKEQDIATKDSQVRVLVIHTQEDWAIAQACWQLMIC